jgi:hypothetical protein
MAENVDPRFEETDELIGEESIESVEIDGLVDPGTVSDRHKFRQRRKPQKRGLVKKRAGGGWAGRLMRLAMMPLLLFPPLISYSFDRPVLPEGFIPDSQVKSLRQHFDYGFIEYEPFYVEGYDWSSDIEIDPSDASFLRTLTYGTIAALDPEAREALRRRVIAHGQWVVNDAEYLRYRELIQAYARGEAVPEGIKGATRTWEGEEYFQLFGESGEMTWRPNGKYPQFQWYPADSAISYYTIFESGGIAMIYSRPIRIDIPARYLRGSFKNRGILEVYNGQDLSESDRMLAISPGGARQVSDYAFDDGKSSSVLRSVGFESGLEIEGLGSPRISSEIDPRWPEGYVRRSIGGFNFLVSGDQQWILDRIDIDAISRVRAYMGGYFEPWAFDGAIIIIPPDLESYSRLYFDEGGTFNWYPAGYAGGERIVYWPLSVPMYRSEEGQAYVWGEDFFLTVVHELVHLGVGRMTGLYSYVPVWLNEGLAVYIETRYSDYMRDYWDTTWAGYLALGRSLPWDDIASRGTASYRIAEARLHYAQSYAMVEYLVLKFGIEKVMTYVASYGNYSGLETSDLPERDFKQRFSRVFGQSWGDALRGFERQVNTSPQDS